MVVGRLAVSAKVKLRKLYTQAPIQDFGQEGPVEFWPQGWAWTQNLLKIGVFSLKFAGKLGKSAPSGSATGYMIIWPELYQLIFCHKRFICGWFRCSGKNIVFSFVRILHEDRCNCAQKRVLRGLYFQRKKKLWKLPVNGFVRAASINQEEIRKWCDAC